MTKKIKVWLQYPWKFPDSPYYKYLIESPPKNIEYLNVKKQKGVITNKTKFFFSNFLKRNIRKITNKLRLPLPNAHLTKTKRKYDLIHCAHCLSKNKSPWVADIESVWSMWISGMKTKKGKDKVRKILLDKGCKKILAWTEYTRKEILKKFPKIKGKVEVVYPAVPPIINSKKTKNKKLKIIFIARYFNIKGGLIALEILERLRKEHSIEGIVVSNVPQKISDKYPKLKILGLINQKELFNLMKKSDIFLYPSAVDTFGFSLLEAMAFGLPIITINRLDIKTARKEIVEHNKEGFVLDIEKNIAYDKIRDYERGIINKLTLYCSKLIKDSKLRKKMSKECIKTIKTGKFSVIKRNKKLKKIYKDVLKK